MIRQSEIRMENESRDWNINTTLKRNSVSHRINGIKQKCLALLPTVKYNINQGQTWNKHETLHNP